MSFSSPRGVLQFMWSQQTPWNTDLHCQRPRLGAGGGKVGVWRRSVLQREPATAIPSAAGGCSEMCMMSF